MGEGDELTKLKLSADVLKLNPELAAAQAKSRAQTPDGEGHHGHVPDAQRYGSYSIPAREFLVSTFKTSLEMERIWGAHWRHTIEAIEVREAIGNYLAMLKGES